MSLVILPKYYLWHQTLNFIVLPATLNCDEYLNMASFFLLLNQNRACRKMKSAGFSFKKSNIHFLKQLCLYFNFMKLTV